LRKRLAFDVEANGLLDTVTKLHCLVIDDLDTGEQLSFADQPGHRPISEGLQLLAEAELLVGHNIIGYDLPAIRKLYPKWSTKALIRDTIVLARLFWPHIKPKDYPLAEKGILPKKLIGAYSLEAFGYRLGHLKDEYDGGWEEWSPRMHSYMLQDGVVTVALYKRCIAEAAEWGVPLEDPQPTPGKDCIELEHRVAEIVFKVERHGFRCNMEKMVALCAKLAARSQELEEELRNAFPPRVEETPFTPKASNKKLGYVKGQPTVKRKTIEFNPGSRQEIARRLIALGWKPKEFGADGAPTLDDEILQALPYPQAKKLAEYFMVQKLLGMVANGKEAWMRHERNGRIHGRIISNGAHTGRMTHSKPNMGQVPGCTDKKTGQPKPYGAECRECFEADEGMVQVGVDADALELRDLAGYAAQWDRGAYIETVLRGDKKNGTDMHTINANAIGCSRETAKTFFYAMVYGSGDHNLGTVIGVKGRAAKEAGATAKANLMRGVPGLGGLLKAVAKKVQTKGFLVGLDGRRLVARAENAALNTLLQSAGAVQMKRGIVLLYDRLNSLGWAWGKDWALMAIVHDEIQASVRPELADAYSEHAVQALRDAGTFYSFPCPLDGQAKQGANWKDTH
jgi:DNA polymerase-1